MGTSTSCYVLEYKDKIFIKEYEIKTPRIRLDDAIYGKVWDINTNDFNKFEERYKLDQSEYNLIQFYNFWCEDLMDFIGEDEHEEAVDNFSKVPIDKIQNARNLRDLLRKILLNEIVFLEKIKTTFLELLLDEKLELVFSRKPSLSDFFKKNTESLDSFKSIRLKYQEFIDQSHNSNKFIILLSYLLSELKIFEKEGIEIQIIFYQY